MTGQIGSDPFTYAFHNYIDTVYRVAMHNISNQADAEDVVQDVFTKLLLQPNKWKDAEHLKAWLIRVTINLCKNHHRAARNRNVTLTDHFHAQEETSAVLEEIRMLPENYRNTIYLHYIEGYTAEEIGAILGVKKNTVLSWLSRGRRQLRERMIGGFDDA